MKKISVALFTIFAIVLCVSAQKSNVISEILKNYAIEKVEKMQEFIKFSNENSEKLKVIEYQFLLDVQKAENCCMCNSAKKIQMLKSKKYNEIQKILPRDEFLKYDSIEKERIKKYPLWTK